MKLLRCKLCRGEVDVIGAERPINKKIKCTQCGYNNLAEPEKSGPEIIIVRKRNQDKSS